MRVTPRCLLKGASHAFYPEAFGFDHVETVRSLAASLTSTRLLSKPVLPGAPASASVDPSRVYAAIRSGQGASLGMRPPVERSTPHSIN